MSELRTTWGKGRVFDVQVSNPDGSAYDLSGLALRFSAKMSRRDDDPADIAAVPQIDAVPTTGKAKLTITRNAITTAFPANPISPLKLYWELEVTGGSASPEVVDTGTLQIDPAVREAA